MKADILIPTDINEIPLSSYQKFMETYKNSTDDEFVCQKMVQIFCGLELRDVLKVRWSDVEDIVTHVSKIFKEKPVFEKTFTLNNVEFGFIPDIENMSFGEYIDLENNIMDLENLHKAMAVLYRPITAKSKGKYQIQQYEGTANYSEVMKYAPLGIALAAKLFFWTLSSELLKSTLQYIQREMKKQMKEKPSHKEQFLLKTGVGINQYMQLLKETLQNFQKSPASEYRTALPGLLLKSRKEISKMQKCKEN